MCACAQLPYAINSSSFRRYDPRNEEISVAPVKKGTSPLSPPRLPSSFSRERKREKERTATHSGRQCELI